MEIQNLKKVSISNKTIKNKNNSKMDIKKLVKKTKIIMCKGNKQVKNQMDKILIARINLIL